MNAWLRRPVWILRSAVGLDPRTPAEAAWCLRHLRRCPRSQPGVARWRGKPLHYADGAALHLQLQEIFVAKAYDFTTAEPSPRIIDGGAHVGLAVMRWRELYPAARITALEADAGIASLLRQNLTTWNDSVTTVLTAAAWVSNVPVAFAPTGSDNGSVQLGGSTTVPGCDLAGLCREPVDLLKLDIEGAEEAVLTHLADTGSLRQVRRLVCEWHHWTPDTPRLHAILDRLVRAGFIYRLIEAHDLGEETAPGFVRLSWPGNQLMLYAWQAGFDPRTGQGPSKP